MKGPRFFVGLSATIGALAAAFSVTSAHANDTDTSPLGKWRFSEIASCGIDDVRAGNLLTVTDVEIRYRAVSCVRDHDNDANADALAALCDIGGAEPLPITFEWRATPNAPTRLFIQGAERPIYRCAENSP